MYDIITKASKEMSEFAKANGFGALLYITDNPQEKADCFFIDGTKARNLRREIQQPRRKFNLVVVLGDTGKNREIVEACPDVLLSPHFAAAKDFMKARNAGLDSVTCKIAAKNHVAIGVDFNEILHASAREREIIFGRIMQNIRLCRKYKVRMLLASFASSLLEMRSPQDLSSLAQIIGMTPKDAHDALEEAARIISKNEGKKDPSYISEGIKVVE